MGHLERQGPEQKSLSLSVPRTESDKDLCSRRVVCYFVLGAYMYI